MNKIIPKLQKIGKNSAPLSVQINLTNRCINRCQMCRKYTWPQKDMDFKVLKEVVNDLIEMKVETIIFSGGEPLMYKKIIDILIYIKKRSNIKIMMISSGLSNFNIFAKAIPKLLDRMYFSVDAYEQDTYTKIRGKGNVDAVRNTVEYYKKYNPNTKIWITEQKDNVYEISKIIKWAKSFNIKYSIFPVHTYDNLKVEPDKKCDCEENKYCLYSYAFAMIHPDGDILSCCTLSADNALHTNIRKELILGNVYDKSFKEIWHSNKAKKIKKMIHDTRQPECAQCDRGTSANNVYNEYLEIKDKEVFL